MKVNNKEFLILDIDLNIFSFCKYLRHEKRVLKSGLNGEEALAELNAYSKLLGMDILDQLKYYLQGTPEVLEDAYDDPTNGALRYYSV